MVYVEIVRELLQSVYLFQVLTEALHQIGGKEKGNEEDRKSFVCCSMSFAMSDSFCGDDNSSDAYNNRK